MNLVKTLDNVVYEFDDHGHLMSKRSAISQDGTVLWTERSQGSFTEWLKSYQFSCKPALVDNWWHNSKSIAAASEEILLRSSDVLLSNRVCYSPLATVQPFHWVPPDRDGTGPPLKFRDLSLPESYQLIAVSVCKRRVKTTTNGVCVAETERHGIDDKAKLERGDLTLKLVGSSRYTVRSFNDVIYDPTPEDL